MHGSSLLKLRNHSNWEKNAMVILFRQQQFEVDSIHRMGERREWGEVEQAERKIHYDRLFVCRLFFRFFLLPARVSTFRSFSFLLLLGLNCLFEALGFRLEAKISFILDYWLIPSSCLHTRCNEHRRIFFSFLAGFCSVNKTEIESICIFGL